MTNWRNSFRYFIVEQSLNSRPLVPASADATEIDALSPNHFLLGITGSSLPSLTNCDFDHRKRFARAHAYSDAICSQWLKENKPSLNSRTKWPSPSNRDLQSGDFDWIVEPTGLRGCYPLARVVKLSFGSDAVARSTEGRTASGNMIHSIIKLFPNLLASDSE